MNVTFQLFSGPNVHDRRAALRIGLDLGKNIDLAAGAAAAFLAALHEALPQLRDDPAPTRAAARGGNVIGQAVLSALTALLDIAAVETDLAELRPGARAGTCDVLCGYEDEAFAQQAAHTAVALIAHLAHAHLDPAIAAPPGFEPARAVRALTRYSIGRGWFYDIRLLIKTAESMDIPWHKIAPDMIVLGHGRHQQRMLESATEHTSHIAARISTSKTMTIRLLQEMGIPVPAHRAARTAEDAVAAAREIGYPVVVKPNDSVLGQGVSVDLTEPKAVAAAFAHARKFSRGVVVEGMIAGDDNRLLVVDGKLIAAAMRLPGRVRGDGGHTIRELVDILNRDPLRREHELGPLSPLEFDARTERHIAAAGLTPDSVPAAGETVILRGTANLATGGTCTDVTAKVHPDNRELAIDVARAAGLDVAGVDLITTDIARSYRETGGAITEVNFYPSLGVHHTETPGQPRAAAGAILDFLFPADRPRRIPIVAITSVAITGAAITGTAITGAEDRAEIVRLTARILAAAGYAVATAGTAGATVKGTPIQDGDRTAPHHVKALLRDRRIDAAVVECPAATILAAGLGFDACDVAAVLGAGMAASAPDRDNGPAEWTAAHRLVAAAARKAVVLDANDPACLAMMATSLEAPVILVSAAGGSPALDAHLAAGGTAAVWNGKDGGSLELRHGYKSSLKIAVKKLAGADDARAAVFAVAIAGAVAITPKTIREALT